jgi:hypothetical protein
MKTLEADRKFIGRETEPDEIEIVKQQGSYIYTARGKKYINFVMGWCVGILAGTMRISKREFKILTVRTM